MSDPNNDRVEAQSGGGKRVDSPPALTPTRLRTSIKATERDIGVISKAQLRRTQHTNRSTSIMETADPPENPLLDSPNIRCASELFPRTEANVSFDGFRTPPGDSPLSSGCPDSPTPKGKPLGNGQRDSVECCNGAQVPLDAGNHKSLSTGVTSCDTNSPTIRTADICLGPATEASTSTLGKVQAKPSQSLELEFALSSELDCPAFELTDLSSVVGPIHANSPSNMTRVDVTTSTASGAVTGFEHAEHLQVTASPDSSKHITSLCSGPNCSTSQHNSPVSLPQELDSDDNNIDLDEMTDDFSVGRPSGAILATIQEGLDHISTYLADLAVHTEQPPQQILNRFLRQYGRLTPSNDWNRYLKYFTAHTEQEMERLQKTGEVTDVTREDASSMKHRRRCYELFKKQYPQSWKKVLSKFEENREYRDSAKTLAQRQQLFNRSAKRLTQSFASLSKAYGIEAAFVMAGNVVNQDTSLGYVYTTPGAENFFLERCRADPDTIVGHLKTHIYNRLSLACVTEAFNIDKSSKTDKGKGKAKEEDLGGHDVVDLTYDNDDPAPDDSMPDDPVPDEEPADHSLVKKLLGQMIRKHVKTWNTAKTFPWKLLPQKLGQNALVCENWPEVLFPGQERPSRGKPKGISDLMKGECQLIVDAIQDKGPHRLQIKYDPFNKAELSTSRKPVIIGAPPSYDSKRARAMRLFSNGSIDYQGPARLPNLAATRIKKQVGGGRVTKAMTRDGDSEDDEPLSVSPSPTPQKLRSTTRKGNTVEPLHVRKRMEVIVPTVTRKRSPSVISLDSSESGEANVGGEGGDVLCDTSELSVSDDEQVPLAHKRKAKSQHYSRAAKRVATSLDTDSTPRAGPKVVKASTQVTKKTRFRIESPLDTTDSEAPENLQSRRITVPMPARSVKADLSMNVSSSKVFVVPQKTPKELQPEQSMDVQSPSQLEEDRAGRIPSDEESPHGLRCDEAMDVQFPPQLKDDLTDRIPSDREPSQVPPRDEAMDVQSLPQLKDNLTSRIPSDRVPLQGPLHDGVMQSERLCPRVPETCIASQEPRDNQSPRIACTEPVPHEAIECDRALSSGKGNSVRAEVAGQDEWKPQRVQNAQESKVPSNDPLAQVANCQSALPELLGTLPVIGSAQHGSHSSLPNPPTQHSSQQPVRPSPHLVQGAGQINNSDEAFNLRRRMYPLPSNASMTEPTAAMPPSSGRLLDAEEGWVDPPPPRHRESHLREQTMHWGPLGPPPDRMYSGDARFGYDGIAYHIGMNHPLYDPSGRGQDARYGTYSSRYLLPPPFVHRYMDYPHDSAMHLQHGAMGRGSYVDPPHPFRSPHMADGHPSGSHDLPAGPYQPGHSSTSINAGASPSIPDDIQRSTAPHMDATLDVSKPAENAAGE